MSPTPEERHRIYEEEKARLAGAEKHNISHVIRYCAITTIVVIVMGFIFETVSDNDRRQRYNDLDKQFLSSLRHVNLLHMATVYFGFLLNPQQALDVRIPPCGDGEALSPCYRFKDGQLQVLYARPSSVADKIRYWCVKWGHPLFRPLIGLVFTAATVASEGWLSAVLIGIATVLSILTLLRIPDFELNLYSVSFAIPAVATVFLSVLLLFGWIVGLVFKGLVQLLPTVAAIPFVGAILLKVGEHHFSAKAIRTLARVD